MRILADKPQERPASLTSFAKRDKSEDEEIVRTEAKALEQAVTAGLQVRVLLAEPRAPGRHPRGMLFLW
jgi:hypothetical protein